MRPPEQRWQAHRVCRCLKIGLFSKWESRCRRDAVLPEQQQRRLVERESEEGAEQPCGTHVADEVCGLVGLFPTHENDDRGATAGRRRRAALCHCRDGVERERAVIAAARHRRERALQRRIAGTSLSRCVRQRWRQLVNVYEQIDGDEAYQRDESSDAHQVGPPPLPQVCF